MGRKLAPEDLSGVWSAAPTPLTDEMKVDEGAVKRMVEHHLRLGVKGLFVAGTNGEGPWLPDGERRRLVRAAVKHAADRLPVAVQVTDNSEARVLDNIRRAEQNGVDIAVLAPPYYLHNTVPGRFLKFYTEVVRRSPLPVGIYDRGASWPLCVPVQVLRRVYSEENVIMVKDSSGDPERRRIALLARKKRPSLRLLTGNEFNCVEYLCAGYDGLLLGGGVFNGYLAGKIMEAASAGEWEQAKRLQRRMNRIMFAVYGGKKIKCWLSGEKKLLVEMGIFRTWKNFPDYPLTDSCRRAIERVLQRDMDVLMPWKAGGHG